MKAIQRISECYRRIVERSRQRAQAKRIALLSVEAESVLQVREFNGKLYICYRDVPLIQQSGLIDPIETAVRYARIAYLQYYKDKNISSSITPTIVSNSANISSK